MGTYWYVDDPDSDEGSVPIYEDDYVAAIFSIAKQHGVNITQKMILEEVSKKWKKPSDGRKKTGRSKAIR